MVQSADIRTAAGDDDVLNVPILETEVQTAIEDLQCGKATGVDGVGAEFFKFAVSPSTGDNVLAKLITRLFDGMFRSRSFPVAWNVAVITPVFKKGDNTQFSNYRPIAVMPVIAKIYASVLNKRLAAWSEQTDGARAPCQAGFRPGFDTNVQLFALRHLIDSYRKQRKLLYCCFVDMTKAYDSVPRDLLWQRLQSVGVTGYMLTAIQAMYAHSRFAVKVDGRVGESFLSYLGVRQGCPLSPLLFGIFIDEYASYLNSTLPQAGARLGDMSIVPLLLYADDMVLVAESAEQLQQQLDNLHQWCTVRGMSVNSAKTEVVVFGNKAAVSSERQQTWKIGSRDIKRTQAFKYLGIVFHSTKGVLHCVQHLCHRAKANLCVMYQQLRELGAKRDIPLTIKLFDAIVRQTLLYGCQVWGTAMLCTDSKRLSSTPMEQVHLGFLRHLVGIRNSVPVHMIYAELNRGPLVVTILDRLIAFWNRVCRMPDGSLPKRIMIDNVWSARHHGDQGTWFAQFDACLRTLQCHVDVGAADMAVCLHEVDGDMVLKSFASMQQQLWDVLPCSPQSAECDVKLATYRAWFATVEPDRQSGVVQVKSSSYYGLRMGFRKLSAVLRFRLGCHNLAIECGRWAKPTKIPRHERVCPHCPHVVQDERHFVLHCPYNAVVRERYSGLLEEVRTMRQLFMTHDQRQVVNYVYELLRYNDMA